MCLCLKPAVMIPSKWAFVIALCPPRLLRICTLDHTIVLQLQYDSANLGVAPGNQHASPAPRRDLGSILRATLSLSHNAVFFSNALLLAWLRTRTAGWPGFSGTRAAEPDPGTLSKRGSAHPCAHAHTAAECSAPQSAQPEPRPPARLRLGPQIQNAG